jgi:hypothetical protein
MSFSNGVSDKSATERILQNYIEKGAAKPLLTQIPG